MKYLIVLMVLLPLLISCSEEANNLTPDRCCANVRIIHVAKNIPTIDVIANQYNVRQRIIRDLSYLNSFPYSDYIEIESTDEVDEFGYSPYVLEFSINDSTNENSELFPSDTIHLTKENKFSYWIADSVSRGYSVLLKDDYTIANTDTAFAQVRLLNISPIKELKLASDQIVSDLTYSGYATIYNTHVEGKYEFLIVDKDNNTITSNQYEMISGEAYTIFYDGQNMGILKH